MTQSSTTTFNLTPKQREGISLAKSDLHKFILYAGGSRSGKSVLISYIVLLRALRAANTRHGIFRRTQVSCNETLFDHTFPMVCELAMPGLLSRSDVKVNKSDSTITLHNGSTIHFGGLDDPARREKLLGNEFATIWVNEVTELDWEAITLLLTRLNQTGPTLDGKTLQPKMFFDCNPKSKKSWEYRCFVEKVNPQTGKPRADADRWVWLRLNPADNLDNLAADYLDTLEESFGAKDRKRYIEGDWGGENEQALFLQAKISANTRAAPELGWVRVVVAVDPAITSHEKSDETGIVVIGLDHDGKAWVLEDVSGRYSPAQWAKAAVDAYHLWGADCIVAEKNQGGDMVEYTLRQEHRDVPVKLVHASRGKEVRAEPVAALYERDRVFHLNTADLDKLEEQMTEFNPQLKSQKSPDRMDALVWGITEIMQLAKRTIAKGRSSKLRGFW